jgi:hypothetical protein
MAFVICVPHFTLKRLNNEEIVVQKGGPEGVAV